MGNGDDLNAVSAYAIHDEEGKAAQQGTASITEIRGTSAGSFGNDIDRPFELPLKTSSRDLVSFAVPSTSSAASGWNSTANRGISAQRVGDGLLPREWS
jgi:hypothetical protein